MVQLILHAGLTKTGSKAIQRGLAAEREALARQGLFYPVLSDSPLPGHWQLGALWRDEMVIETESNVIARLDDWGTPEENRRRLMALLAAEIARARAWEKEGAEAAVLLSDELLGYPGALRACRQLARLAERQGAGLWALAWARPDPDLFVSLVQQQAKSLAHPFVYRNLSHPPQVARLRKAFGPALHLGLYDRTKDSLAALLALVATRLNRPLAPLPPRPRANEQISAPGCALLIEVSQRADPLADREAFRALRRALMEADLPAPPLTLPALTLPDGWEARIRAHGAKAWNAMLRQAGIWPQGRLAPLDPAGLAPIADDEIRAWVTAAPTAALRQALLDWLGPAPKGWKAEALGLLTRRAD